MNDNIKHLRELIASYNASNKEEIDEFIDAIEAELNGPSGTEADLRQEISELTDKVSDLEGEIDELEDRNSADSYIDCGVGWLEYTCNGNIQIEELMDSFSD